MARLHRELATDADVHSIDLPGFGAVPKPPMSPSVIAVAKALGSLLDQLAVTHAVVIGHSMGVQWGVELGVIRPGLVSDLVLIGPVTDMAHRSLPYQALMSPATYSASRSPRIRRSSWITSEAGRYGSCGNRDS
jgi:pimeloyl-ACP methyl ester carboxylesterase